MEISAKRFNGIDITKFVMSIFVVGIHTLPFAESSNHLLYSFLDCLFALAVPFFFIASGYLIAQKGSYLSLDDYRCVVKKQMLKILRMYIVWSIVYMPMSVYYFWSNGISFVNSIFNYLQGFIFVGENYNSWMLWYLLSTVYALIFIFVSLKFTKNIKIITLVGFVIYFLGVFITEFSNSAYDLPTVFYYFKIIISKTIINGRIFTGFFFIPLGMLLAEKKFSSRLGIVVLGLAFIGNLILTQYGKNIFVYHLLLIICSIGLFSFISDIDIKNSPIYSIFRESSTIIYLVHMYIWTAYYSLVYKEKSFGWDSFLVTVFFSVLGSITFIFIKRFKKSKK